MLEKTEEILKMYARGKKLAVAVSGGRDSMCLLHFLLSSEFIAKSDILAVNVEHGIRGADSLSDSAFVEKYCKDRNVAFVCESVDVPARKAVSGRSEEQEARIARREVFARILADKKAELVLTAHHMGDNAETVLMHILRGSGLNGLRGMDVMTKSGILRPLLYASRTEIDKYIALNAVPYVEDATNGKTDYLRNFIRHEIMPRLNTRCNAERSLLSLSERARTDDDFICSFLSENALENAPLGGVRIASERLTGHESLACRYAVKMLRRFTEDYGFDGVDALIKCARARSGARVEIAGGLEAANEYGSVTLYRPALPVTNEYAFDCGSFDFGGFTATVKECENFKPEQAKAGNGEHFIDLMKVPEGALLRTRKTGERITPFGGGERKLKEFFIDRKIPVRLRASLPLLCLGKNVLAVFGVEIARALAVDETTRRVAVLSVLEEGEPWKG